MWAAVDSVAELMGPRRPRLPVELVPHDIDLSALQCHAPRETLVRLNPGNWFPEADAQGNITACICSQWRGMGPECVRRILRDTCGDSPTAAELGVQRIPPHKQSCVCGRNYKRCHFWFACWLVRCDGCLTCPKAYPVDNDGMSRRYGGHVMQMRLATLMDSGSLFPYVLDEPNAPAAEDDDDEIHHV